MKKEEIIDKLLVSDYWEDIYHRFVRIGLEKTSKKELIKWLDATGIEVK